MAVKMSITKDEHDKLPEAVRALYTEKDGKFSIEIEGAPSASEVFDLKSKVAEFRDKNIELMKQQEEWKPVIEKVKGIDLEAALKASKELDDLKKKGVGKADDLDAKIAQALEAATKPLKEQLATEAERRQKAEAQALDHAFSQQISDLASKKGARPNSVRHIVREAREKFDLVDGQLKPKPGVKHPSDPLRELSPVEWLDEMAKNEDYLFEPSAGGGANGGRGSGGAGGKRQLINPTPEEMGRHMEAIAKGDIVVVRQ